MSFTRWGHSVDDRPERWTGAFHTRAEAIADGRATYPESFYVKSGSLVSPYAAMPRASDLIEQMGEYADDNWGDEEFPDVSRKAQAELDELLESWCEKHLSGYEGWAEDGHPAERIALEPEVLDERVVRYDETEDTEPSGPTEP